MKSQESALLHVVRGVCKDVLAAYPAIEGLGLDIERLALYCQTRGLALFTLDLPNLDSLLLSGLESGRLQLSGPLSRRVSKRVKVPRLFSGLWLRVFDREACLRQDADVTSIFFLRQLCCIGKKLEVECTPDRIATTLEAYHDIEESIRRPTLGWEFDELDDGCQLDSIHLVQALDGTPFNNEDLPLFSSKIEKSEKEVKAKREDRILLVRVQQVADLILGTFDFFDPIEYSAQLESEAKGIGFKHGPGAVAEKRKNWEKSTFLHWPAKLERLFPFKLCGTTAGFEGEVPLNHEGSSVLYCVPKTAKGPRLIAAEPASHMWCQKCIESFLRYQFKKHFGESFIDLNDQTKSGALVLQASRDRLLATVDLSDASDRLSCWTVERIFRKHSSLLYHLHAARTRLLRDNISKDKDSFIKLKKFATQGTACTFPVQSLVFLCIALASSIEGNITWHKIRGLRTQVRVYGDDIIIPSHGYARLNRIMVALGLKVNIAKSYVNGHFRESCGVEGYRGYDVTPVKPKTLIADSPASCQAVVDTSNNLFNKGLWYASDSLRAFLPARLRRGIRIVGINDAGFAGLTSYSGSDESHLAKRWNSRLHRYEVRVWTLLVRTQERDRQGLPALLDFFASKHNHEHARIVSEYRDVRKTRDGFLWEPLNTGARLRDT
ncbi:TPA_asm: RNA-directed RNA polymerase [ssRNA phage Gerhypos.2_23]|uniref:RNA-directed RNA polymerase n=2 Tax=Leviviricetes TaxID=2842243 RepID=A0A8S5L2G8_9VIRU|nr:RNA-directed RNA polymerase [ssRNA phage Gerhypos.2_23]QDH88925.1 MAG: RNA-dependent RNA polymerase [Leviviridae sp.]DAD51338.1 TPA_asm: RNA-directed RNA polymerase [ssRNA phage Gerhypos.2_23]